MNRKKIEKHWADFILLAEYAERQAELFPEKYKDAHDYIMKECTTPNGKHDFSLTDSTKQELSKNMDDYNS